MNPPFTLTVEQSVQNSLLASLLGGGVFGTLLQLSTLGMNSILQVLWKSHSWSRSEFEFLVPSLLWACASGLLSLAVLGVFRRRVLDLHRENKRHKNFVLQVERHFVIGAVAGIFCFWTLIDLVAGDYSCLVTNFVTATIAMAFCCALAWYKQECQHANTLLPENESHQCSC